MIFASMVGYLLPIYSASTYSATELCHLSDISHYCPSHEKQDAVDGF